MGEGECDGKVGRDGGLSNTTFARGNADDSLDIWNAAWLRRPGASTRHSRWNALIVAGKAEWVLV